MGRAVGGTASSRLLRAVGAALLGLALIGMVTFLVGHVGLTRDHAGVDRASALPAPDLVRLRWRPDELVPARSAGHICVRDAAHGRICASFSAGERPSLALTHEVERRGMFIRERQPEPTAAHVLRSLGWVIDLPRAFSQNARVGWRDRDWAKFDEEETRALLGPSRIGPRSGTARRVTGGATLLAVGVSAASIIFFAHLHEIGRPGRRAAQVLSPSPSVVARAPSDVVAINWSVADTMPAPQAGRICVTDALHGQICASYVVGERPADNLTREIERRGLRVQSSG